MCPDVCMYVCIYIHACIYTVIMIITEQRPGPPEQKSSYSRKGTTLEPLGTCFEPIVLQPVVDSEFDLGSLEARKEVQSSTNMPQQRLAQTPTTFRCRGAMQRKDVYCGPEKLQDIRLEHPWNQTLDNPQHKPLSNQKLAAATTLV